MNLLAGSESFPVGGDQIGVTREFVVRETEKYLLVDTPGFQDNTITPSHWLDELKKVNKGGHPIALAILAIRGGQRVRAPDLLNLLAANEVCMNLSPKNLAIMFGDNSPRFNE